MVAAGTAPLSYQWQKNGATIGGRDVGELHDSGDRDDGQRIDIRRGGQQHGRDGDEQRSDADGECGGSGADDHHTAGESDGNDGADGDVLGGGRGHSAVELPVAEERRAIGGGDFGQLHDSGDRRRRTMGRRSAWWSATPPGT